MNVYGITKLIAELESDNLQNKNKTLLYVLLVFVS